MTMTMRDYHRRKIIFHLFYLHLEDDPLTARQAEAMCSVHKAGER